MALKYVILIACIALVQAGLVRREAAAAGQDTWADIQKKATEFSKTVTDQVNAFANSKDTENFNKALKQGTDDLLNNFSKFSESLQGAITDAGGKAKESFAESSQNIKKTVEDLRKAHPEVEADAAKLKEKFQNTLSAVAKQTEAIAKTASTNLQETNEKVAPKLKAALDDFAKQFENIQKQIHDVATKQ